MLLSAFGDVSGSVVWIVEGVGGDVSAVELDGVPELLDLHGLGELNHLHNVIELCLEHLEIIALRNEDAVEAWLGRKHTGVDVREDKGEAAIILEVDEGRASDDVLTELLDVDEVFFGLLELGEFDGTDVDFVARVLDEAVELAVLDLRDDDGHFLGLLLLIHKKLNIISRIMDSLRF